MTRQDISRRQQLVARLKSSIATAAIVGTLGGWIAFGVQQNTASTVATTNVPAVAAVVAQPATNNDTATVGQASQSGDTSVTTEVASAAVPSTSNSTTTQSNTTQPSSPSMSVQSSRRGAVTTTRSSR